MTPIHSTTVMDTPSFPIIRTKLQLPGRRAQSIARDRLLALLEGHPTSRLILVNAPAGFGKTTFVVEWLYHTGAPAAWYALDERDNDFTRFLTYLIAALQSQIPHFGEELLAGLLHPPSPSSQLAMDALLSELTSVSQGFVLVLDDYHLLHNEEIHHNIATLLDYLPSQVHLVIISRRTPDLPLAKWRARNQLFEVTAAALRFDRLETEAFLRTTMALTLSGQAITELEQRTEGWAAGLQLAVLSMQGTTNETATIQSFTGNDRYVADYLMSEVMARQPAALQSFLERTAILEQFNAGLCDYLLEMDESRQLIETIDRANLFLIALDNHREWYRYHHLFGELLRNRLTQAIGEDGVAQLHRRAAGWYAQAKRPEDAIRHSLAGGDAPTAAEVVSATPLEFLWQPGGASMTRRCIEELPVSALEEHPRAALIGALANLLVGDVPATIRYVALTEDVPYLDAERKLLQAIFARNEGRFDGAVELLHAAQQGLGPDQWLLKIIAQLQIAIAYMEVGEFKRSTQLLTELKGEVEVNSQAGLTMLVQVTSFECMLASMRGDLNGAKRSAQQTIAVIQASPYILPMVGQIYAMLGGIAYMQNELDEAQEALTEALHWGERTGITDILFTAYDTQIKLHCARNERNEALAKLQRLRILYENTKFPEIIRFGRAEEAATHLRLGNLATAMAWITESAYALTDPIDPRARSIYHILATIYLTAAQIKGDRTHLDAILDLAQRLTEQSIKQGQLLPNISALLLQTQALALQGKQTQATERLSQALELAEPGKFIRIFLDSGPIVAELLRSMAATQPGNAFLAAILQAFPRNESSSIPLANPLTEREVEILGLIAAGLSNKAIEDRLYVSHNTVRTHIKNLYSKLAVSSRTQAVRKGQALGLIDEH